jgi:hypothetical protein
VFHIELRQFPHNMCKFNMTERELLDTIVNGWAQGQWIEMGERKWNPHQAKLTVLEGPQIPIDQLSIGRGWSNAQHHGEDVTERVLAQARQASQPGVGSPAVGAAQPGVAQHAAGTPQPGAAAPQTAAAVPASDPTVQLRPLLGSDPAALLAAWRLTAERRPELQPSESLALAETTLSSLDAGER